MPNTTVKTRPADGTALETVRKSRWPPVHLKTFLKKKREKPEDGSEGMAAACSSWDAP